MTGTNHRRSGPKKDEIAVVAWLFSRRIWTATALLSAYVAAVVAVLGWTWFGADLVATGLAALTDPWSVLLIFVCTRALAHGLVQYERGHRYRSGDLAVGDGPSTGAILTVASFSLVGLVAAAAAFPGFYDVDGLLHTLAVGVTLLAVPLSYPLLVHQLSERVAADRYRGGYRVSPAVWQFIWSLPAVLVAWFLVTGTAAVAVPVPAWTASFGVPSAYAGAVVDVTAWEVAYATVATPTVFAFLYPVRRRVDAAFRLLPG